MKIWASKAWHAALIALMASAFLADAVSFQIVPKTAPAFSPPTTGGGDSALPIVSPDGRYVLFASTANNLALMSNNAPVPAVFPAKFNVYLRDRTNGTTELASVNLTGVGGGNGDSFPAGISSDGQFALFESAANNLVATDTNNATDLFVRDMVNGTTLLVSISTNGGVGSGASRSAVLTPDGRYVAFVSAATNLVAGDTNKIPDVFVRDLQSGTTKLVSVGATSTNSTAVSPFGSSESPSITPDGHYVVFFSTATNLVPGIRLSGEVYVRDMVGETTAWASVNSRTMFQNVFGSTNAFSCNTAISDDGRYVAFETITNSSSAFLSRGLILHHDLQTILTDVVHTNANVPLLSYENIHNLDMTSDGRFIAYIANVGVPGTNTAVYLWEAQTGSSALVSGDLGDALPANAICDSPAVSSNGQYVAFLSSGSNLTANASGGLHVYIRDILAAATELLSADTNGIGAPLGPVTTISMSAEGGTVAFEAAAASLVDSDRNVSSDVFVRDTGAVATELISAHHPGLPSFTPNGPSAISSFSVNKDARFVAFTSDADDLSGNDTNGLRDVFVRDLMGGANSQELVSLGTNGFAGSGLSSEPAISADGRYIAFASTADDLAAGDTNKMQDVFVRDMETGVTVLLSMSTDGIHSGNGASFSPTISGDGNLVVFRSRANNLAPGSFTGGTENLFYHDKLAGTNGALTLGGVAVSAMTPDGRYVAFTGRISGGAPTNLYVWDSQLNQRVYTNTTAAILSVGIGISADGNRLAFAAGNVLTAVDRVANTSQTIGAFATPISGLHPGLRFSGDGRFLVYSRSTVSGTVSNQVYVCDLETGNNLLVSRVFYSSIPANGVSDSPEISADGRYVIYRSAATNIVAGDNNGFPDLFVYDRLADTNTLLTSSVLGNVSADNRSLRPVFSGDGRKVVFQSWASDLTGGDFNFSGDVFAYSFFYANVVTGNPPTISWPFDPTQTYHAQYKDDLGDTEWHDILVEPTIMGSTAVLIDPAPSPGLRFYRVVAE